MPSQRQRVLAVIAHAGWIAVGLAIAPLHFALWGDWSEHGLGAVTSSVIASLSAASLLGIGFALAVRRASRDDAWVHSHAEEAVVVHRTLLLWYAAGAVLFIVFVGAIIIFLAFLVYSAHMCNAAGAAWRGEPFDYRQVHRGPLLRPRPPRGNAPPDAIEVV